MYLLSWFVQFNYLSPGQEKCLELLVPSFGTACPTLVDVGRESALRLPWMIHRQVLQKFVPTAQSNHANDKINNHPPTLQILCWLKRVACKARVMCSFSLGENIHIYVLRYTYICTLHTFVQTNRETSRKHYAAQSAIFFDTNQILTEWCRVHMYEE